MIRNIIRGPVLHWFADEGVLNTSLNEGTVKAIVRGTRGNGPVDSFHMSFRGYHLNDPRFLLRPETKRLYTPTEPPWEVLYHGEKNKLGFTGDMMLDETYDLRDSHLVELGLYPVGMPWERSVHVYQFEWNETITDEQGKTKIWRRAEPTDFAFVSDFTYAIIVEGAETGFGENLPVDIVILVTVAIRNPYRALFSGEDWMRRVVAAITALVRTYVGKHSYRDLIAPGEDLLKNKEAQPGTSSELDNLMQQIKDLSKGLPSDKPRERPRGLHGRYGVEIRTADMQSIALAGTEESRAKLFDSSVLKYAAQQQAEAIRTTGQAEADVIALKGAKEAESLQKRLDVLNGSSRGMRLAELDAMVLAGEKGNLILFGNNESKTPIIINPKGGAA